MKTGAGLGFVLGDGVVGVDLDHCHWPEPGTLKPWAAQIVEAVGGYTEISPSGTGVHIFAEGALPKGFKRGPVEVYGTGAVRYLTVTGNVLRDRPVDAAAGKRLADLYPALHDAGHFLASLKPESQVRAYWLNEKTPEDDSAADWATICEVAKFFNDGNAQRIERALRLSGLARPKWDERRGEVTKIQYDIQNALKKLEIERPVFMARELEEIVLNPLPDPVMLVEGMVEATTINMIAGPSYAGKSTIGLDLALSVSAGLAVFGRFRVSGPVNVAYIYGEQGEARWEKRLRDITEFRGVALANRPNRVWLVKGRGMKFNQTPVIRGFQEWCKERGIGMAIFDPLSTLFPADQSENDAADVIRRARGPLETLVDAGMTVVVMHHSSKGMGRNEDARAGDLVRGSGDLQAMTSSIIGVQYVMEKQAVIVKVQGRDETASPFALTAGGRPLAATVSEQQTKWAPVAFAGWLSDVQDVAPEMRVLVALGDGPQKIADLSLKLSLSEKTVKNYLTRLRRKGSVESDNRGLWSVVSPSSPAPDPTEDTEADL